jgi:beta-phosphoglucomutase
MKQYLAIFDLDGTLFDTYPANWLSYRTALSEHGYEISEQYFREHCQGKYYRDFLPPLINGADETILQSIHQRKQELYKTHLDQVQINIHLFRILEGIRTTYYTAIVTTASRQNCTELLEHFNKTSHFDLILTREDVKNSKPDPEGFMKVINYFSMLPEQTIIFEDSPEGIDAAEKTGSSILTVQPF